MIKGTLITLFFIVLMLPVRSQLLINEFQASNINTGVDPNVNYRQWVEIYNGGDRSIDLYGYYVSDQTSEPGKYKILEHIYVSSKKAVLLWLDPDNGDYGELKLDMDGGDLLISDPAGEVLDYIAYPAQYIDISFGRDAAGYSGWSFFMEPTPGAPNFTKGYPEKGAPDSLRFSLTGGFYYGPQQVSLSTNSTSGIIRFTKDGSWPEESSPQYGSPIEITSSCVIRARVFYEDKLPGEVITHTYFLNESSSLPVVSISSDPRNFFSGDRGIYVEGYRGISGWCSPDPVNWNRDWERPVNFEYYTADGEQVINQLAGTKITGGCSRFNSFKSLALYARKRYGDNSFSYQFFSSKNISDFKGLVLRNSGNDGYYSMLRDGFMQSLVMGEMDIDYLGYQPANIFINGEYWGILNVREKINEHYPATNYSIDPDRVDMLEKEDYFDYNLVITGSGEHYAELMDFVEQNDLSLESNFSHVSTMMDVEEFLNYYLVDIYFQNEDWPQNNIKYWRYQGDGGKWRWILYDTDFGWGLFPQSGNSLNWATRGASSDRLIRALLKNDQFKYEFIQRMAGMMNTVFHPDRVKSILDRIGDELGREIPRHTQRWGRPSAIEYDYQTNNKMPRFAETRPDSMRLFMRYKFGISGLVTLSASVNDPLKGSIQAAGVNLPDQHSGLYFRNVPLRMVAVPEPGYVFSHWEGSSSSSSSTIYLDLESGESVKAVFKAGEIPGNIFLNELGASNDSAVPDEYEQWDDWIEIYNGNDYDVDLAGSYLSDSAGFPEMYQIPFGSPELTTVGAKEYLLIWCDDQPEQGALHTNFKLEKDGESLFLSMKKADSLHIIDSLTYSEQYTDVSYGRKPETDRWDYLLPTPGRENLIQSSVTILINEFVSRNEGPHKDESGEADDWIELYNPTDDSIDIGGLFLTDSLRDPLKHQVPMGEKATIIPPKGFLVLWADGQEEQGGLHLGFKLDARSEEIGIYQLGAGFIDSLSYLNAYPEVALGRFPDGNPAMQYLSASPGSGNGIYPLKGLFINEFLSRNINTSMDEYGEYDDWIEIYNGNDYPVDLGGLFLSDSLADPAKHRIPGNMPDSTTVPARGYLLLWADGQEEQGVLHLGFKLDSKSEQIGLYQVEAGMIDSLSYQIDYPEIPMGRLPDASPNLQYLSASPGSENGFIRKEGLFINEFVANNLSSIPDEYGEFDDWIEIYNASDDPIDLGGIFLTDSLGEPSKHQIPSGIPDSTTIPAHGYLLLWADGQEQQGVRHLGFRLDSKSEQIGIYQVGAGFIDSLSYLVEFPDLSTGRLPDAGSQLQYVSATPGEANQVSLLDGIYINEMMPKNLSTLRDEYGEFDDWIEIYNGNDYPVDLGGTFVTDSLGHPTKYRIPTYAPDSTTVPAHAFLILWADKQKEQGVLHLDFSLSSNGEQFGLFQADGLQLIDTLTYGSLQADQAFGLLEGEDPGFRFVTATPGEKNYLRPSERLLISEIVAAGNELHPDEYGEYDDWIEIYNFNEFEVDIGGFYLTDSIHQLQKFRIPSHAPDQTSIEPGGHLVLWADGQAQQGLNHMDFSLKGGGEFLALVGPSGTEIIDSVSFPNQYKHFSYSRDDNSGAWKFFPPTPGAWNHVPSPSGLYINEFMAANTSIPSDGGGFEDWIEIYNANNYSVNLGGLYLTDSIGDPTKFRIPSHSPQSTTIGPGDYMLIFADDQKDRGINHASFKLRREGEQIALIHYDEQQVIDSVSYREQFKGASLSKIGKDGTWLPIPPTPGSENVYPDLSKLVINEVMGNNITVSSDEFGEYEDWVELYNKGDVPLDIGGLYFSDSLADRFKYRVPSGFPDSTTIAPYGHLILWADNTPDQGILHLGFGISKRGEEIGIFDYTGILVDSISYPFISPNVSWGRLPDGFEAWQQFHQPTPSESNVITMVKGWGEGQDQVTVYPNPLEESAIFEIPVNAPGKIRIEIIDSHGVLVSLIHDYSSGPGKVRIPWDAKDASGAFLSPGLYFFHVFLGAENYSGKFVVR